MAALGMPSLGEPGHVDAILEAKNRTNAYKFQPVYLGKFQY